MATKKEKEAAKAKEAEKAIPKVLSLNELNIAHRKAYAARKETEK